MPPTRDLHTPAGASDPDLTEEGQRHAALLATWFAGREPPATIFVSRTKRAQQTAAPLAGALGIPGDSTIPPTLRA